MVSMVKTRNLELYSQKDNSYYSFNMLVKDLVPDPNNPRERMIKGC